MARREFIKNEYEVSTHYTLFFWKQCNFCGQEFRRESGYKWPLGHSFGHACPSCCCSVSHCNDMLNYEYKRIAAAMLGTIPPAPPMRTYRIK